MKKLDMNCCPFCESDDIELFTQCEGKHHWVKCNNCDAEGPIKTTAVIAVVVWNSAQKQDKKAKTIILADK